MSARPWRWIIAGTTGVGVLVAGIGFGLVSWAERESLDAVNTLLADAAPWLLLWRIGLFAGLIVYWKELARWAARAFSLSAASSAALAQWRWRAAAWLLLMDLVLVEDLIGRIQRVLA